MITELWDVLLCQLRGIVNDFKTQKKREEKQRIRVKN